MYMAHGLGTLEIQQRLYRFLYDCTKQILHEISEEELLSYKYPIRSEPDLAPIPNTFPSLTSAAKDAPYKSLEYCDFRRLERIASAARSASEDRLWLLRDDPGYFAEAVKQYEDHRQEQLSELDGDDHVMTSKMPRHIFCSHLLNRLHHVSSIRRIFFAWAQKQLLRLIKLEREFACDISDIRELPEELSNALEEFWLQIRSFARALVVTLYRSLKVSQPFRQYYTLRQRSDGKMETMLRPQSSLQTTNPIGFRIMLLFWLLQDEGKAQILGMHNVLHVLQNLLHDEIEARQMITPFLAERLSDLTITIEFIRHMKLYQPWNETIEHRVVANERELLYEKRVDWPQGTLHLTASDLDLSYIGEKGDPTDGKFFYPNDKKRTRESVRTMQLAEYNLDEFWKEVDQLYALQSEILHPSLQPFLEQDKMLSRISGLVNMVEPNEFKALSSVEQIRKPLSATYFDLMQKSKQASSTTKAKKKGNARCHPSNQIQDDAQCLNSKTNIGTPSSLLEPFAESTAADQIPASPTQGRPSNSSTTVYLNKRAYRVFSTLLSSSDRSQTPSEIAWPDFLHAMVSVGFAPEKFGGSAWLFHAKKGLEHTILFHEPWPAGKMSVRTARWNGKRLNRWFGWDGETFKRV